MFDKKSSWKEKENTLEKSDVLLLLVCQRLWTNKVMLLQAYAIGHFHGDDIWLQLPEFISFLLCYWNLSIPLRIKEQ